MARRKTWFALAILLAATGAEGASSLGGERVATNAGAFLKIGVGAKAVGLGEAFTSVADDATALFWNPAGLVNLPRREVHFSHTSWIADINYEYLAYAQPLDYLGGIAVGFHVGSLRTDMMETTEYEPYGTGREFTYSDLFVGVGAARRFTDKLSIGVGIKYVRENYGSAIAGPVVDTWTADFGTFYHIGIREAVFSVAFLNFGPDWKPGGSYQQYSGGDIPQETDYQSFGAPTTFKASVSGLLWELEDLRQIGVLEMNRPPDNSETYRVATEVEYRHTLALRTGYSLNSDELKWSGGIGLRLGVGHVTDQIDYAFTASDYLGRVDRISLGVDF